MNEHASQSPAASLLGRVVDGRYELLEIVGEGAFGAVYRARDCEGGGSVAVKVLHTELASEPEALARFQREAKAASMLRHPCGVEVHGFGAEDGLHFIVMEFVAGRSLDEVLEDGPIQSLRRVVRIASQVCDALTAAHARGIVHRDIKPGNILLVGDGDDVQVKVCDFGVARLRAGADSNGRPLTMVGQVLGTPAYLSPEQARGDTIDHRCDLYALGVVIYEMTTWRLPFEAESPFAVLAQHMTQPPPPPSGFDPAYPRALERVVLRCLAKKPEARFPTASHLQAELEALLRDPVVHSWSSTLIPVFRAPARDEHDTDGLSTAATRNRRTLEPEASAPDTADSPALDAFHIVSTDPTLRPFDASDEPEAAARRRMLTAVAIAVTLVGVLVALWLAL